MASRWEKAFLAAAAVLFALGAAADGLGLRQTRGFVPAGLLTMSLINVRLRSKALAWGVFAVSFVWFMIVFGPFAVGLRAPQAGDTLKFMRAIAMFLSLSLAALFQLRASRGG